MSESTVLKHSLGRRLPVVFGLFVVLAMALLIVLAGVRLHSTLTANLTSQLESRARQDARMLLHRFEFLLESVALLVKNPLVVNAIVDAKNRQGYLPETIRNFREGRDVHSVALVDREGQTVYSTLEHAPDLHEFGELRDALVNGSMGYRLDASAGRWYVFAPVAVNATTPGALVVAYDIKSIAARILAADAFFGHELKQGEIRLFQHAPAGAGDVLRTSENLAQLGAGYLAGMNLTLAVTAPRDFYLAPVRVAVRDMVILGALLTLAAVVFSRMLARRIVRPILALVRRIDSPNAGGQAGMALDGDDEIQLLAKKFDERTQELNGVQQHLEDLVAQRTQELAQAKQAAEDASFLKSSFLASMSHEIRTPLNAIIGLTHMIRRLAVDPAQITQLDKVMSAARHLLSLINNILDFSKIEAGKLTVENEDFYFVSLLDDLRTLVGERIAEKKLAFEVDVDPAVPTRLRGDSLRLNQVLINFTSNAVKFTDQGSITLRVRCVGAEGDGLRVRFELIDTGIGMTEEQTARLFQPFEQADTSTSRRFGGTGLGLAISRSLVDLMGGRFGVFSAPGQGSTFWFEVPLGVASDVPLLSATADLKAEAASTATDNFTGLRVLLVEDNPVNQEVAADLLNSLGATVEIAVDGVEALEKTAMATYDVLLMDMQMPRLDGISATRALRQKAATASVPIIAMTANAFAEDRRRCLEAGMNAFVAKPVDPDALIRALESCLPPRARVAAAVNADHRDDDATRSGPPPMSGAQPGNAPESLRARLEAVDGLDVVGGLHVFRNRLPSYVRVLRKYIEHERSDVEPVLTALDAGQIEEATMLVHALKGSSASLGFAKVHVLTRKIEASLKSGIASDHPALRQDLEELRAVFPVLLAQLREALREDESG